MGSVHLHSEPFSRDGNIAADGAARLLGQPALSPLELVIRETIQNSWDASLLTSGTPRYSVRIRHLDSGEMDTMRSFFEELPPEEANEPIASSISKFLRSSGVVMEICDECTQGLDGPTSASRSLRTGESANFVNFIRNIGSARDLAQGGGTYGFGKSSLFKISRCHAIVVHTLIAGESGLEHRLIGQALGAAFDHDGRRFTGRHWWGAQGEDDSGSVDPVLNSEASRIAASMGFQERNIYEQRGTSLMILDPDLEELDPEGEFRTTSLSEIRNHLSARIQDAILWHCWPKFTHRGDGTVPMHCHLSILGDELPLPDPSTIQPLWLLTQALNKARAKEDLVQCLRPKKLLGFFGDCSASLDLLPDSRFRRYLGEKTLIPEKLQHVALLRPAELVVRYEEGSINEIEQRQWAGVFITDIGEEGEVEKAFAMSEPPAHDDWQPDAATGLSKHQQTFVRVALVRIKERIKELSGSDLKTNQITATEARSSLASLAGDFGRSLIGAGTGGSDGTTRTKAGGAGKKAALRLGSPISEGTTLQNGSLVACFKVRLSGPTEAMPCVMFTPWIQMDESSKEVVAPNGRAPEIIGVEIESRSVVRGEKGYVCPVGAGGSTIRVLVSIPDYVAVGLTASIEEGAEA